MKVIIAGGGVGGLVTGLMLHARGIDCEIFEQSDAIRELGVGINTLPHAIKELADLGLLDRLDAVAIRTYELIYSNRFGQEIWREPRGLDAGYDIPQFSIHRGRLQNVIYQAARARLGELRIHLNCRLGSFTQDDSGVTAYFFDRGGSHRHTARGDILVGADGIHSVVREKLFPNEGPPRWNGLMLWRGATDWPAFLTGRSMVVAGGLAAKLVIYPIAEGSRRRQEADQLGGDRPRRRCVDAGAAEAGLVAPRPLRGFDAACAALPHPLCRRARADRGNAASSGNIRCATAIRCRAGATAASRCSATPRIRCIRSAQTARRRPFSMPVSSPTGSRTPSTRSHALWLYEQTRLPVTAEIVQSNRRGGPEGVIDAVEERAPDGFSNIEDVLSFEQRKAIVRGYASKAGFAREQVNKAA